jgi:tetratricopeptide (TPR) repeat protein
VFAREHNLRHLPFFEEIAAHDEGDAAWRSATAGLVALRLVDAWLESAPLTFSDDFGTRSVRATIDAMDDGTPIKSILARVVDSLEEQKPDIHVVVTPLMAYGQALEYDAKWYLAADVYRTVLAHLHPAEDSDASIAAHLRLGQCYRSLNQLDDAATAFCMAFEVATGADDIVGILRARIGEARIATIRGNLPQATRILDETIGRATTFDLSDVRSRALHDRSDVARLTGEYELAIRLGYEALGFAQSTIERDRILSDIAAAFFHLGVYGAARDAYLVLASTAQEQYVRWAATLNLLELATHTGSEMLFELYRRQLSDQKLPPRMATVFQLYVGTGYQQFGDFQRAHDHLTRALALASEHGLNQHVFEAEEALQNVRKPTPLHRPEQSAPLGVEEVALAIQNLRETVGAR